MTCTQETLPGGYIAFTSPAHRFQTDALRLAVFSFPKDGERVCDLGTGCGSIPLWWFSQGGHPVVDGVDKQAEAVALAADAASANGWQDRFRLWQEDWEALSLSNGQYDRVVCNPPYYREDSGGVCSDGARRIVRQESPVGMSGWIGAAARLLRYGGRLCVCHRPERMVELLLMLREAGLEPKRMQWVQRRPDTSPWLLLCEARKGGRPGITVEPVWIEEICEHKEEPACPEH